MAATKVTAGEAQQCGGVDVGGVEWKEKEKVLEDIPAATARNRAFFFTPRLLDNGQEKGGGYDRAEGAGTAVSDRLPTSSCPVTRHSKRGTHPGGWPPYGVYEISTVSPPLSTSNVERKTAELRTPI